MGCSFTGDLPYEVLYFWFQYKSCYPSVKREDTDLIMQIFNEHKKCAFLLKPKIDELCEKRDKAKPVEIGRGNCCNNPCYEYNTSIIKECPKCGGKVDYEVENGYTITKKWNYYHHCYEDEYFYNENVCDKFKFNNKISREDYDIEEFFKYFKKTEKLEGETFREYMIIDGKRFNAPILTSLEVFFIKNDKTWFPQDIFSVEKDPCQPNQFLRTWLNTCFYDHEWKKRELGQSLGYYRYIETSTSLKHYVFIFKCILCGLKYHIIRTSPFRFRDRTKDNKITEIKKVEQENQENQENKSNK